MNKTPSGLQYEDTVTGDGAEAKPGQYVQVHYTGWLYNDGQQGASLVGPTDVVDGLGQRPLHGCEDGAVVERRGGGLHAAQHSDGIPGDPYDRAP